MNSKIILPGFEVVLVKSVEIIEDKLFLHVEMPVIEQKCPHCKKKVITF